MQEEACPFSKDFQFSLIRLFLEDRNVFAKLSKFIQRNNAFESEILWFFYILILDYFEKENDIPGETYITNEINKTDNPDKYLKVYEQIKQASLKDRQYILDQLKPFVKAFLFLDIQEDMAEVYNSNPDKAYEAIDKLKRDLDSVNFDEDNVYHLKDIFEALESQKNDTVNKIKTGIEAFDRVFQGGVGAGEVLTFLARDGVGKSMCLMNIGALALEAGKNVLHVHCEGKKIQPLLRYTSRLTGIKYNNIIAASKLDEKDKELIKEKAEKLNDQLIIKPFLSISRVNGSVNTGTTIEDLIAYCAELYQTFKFDVVIVDYGDKLDTRQKTEANRFVSDVVWTGLEKIGAEFNVPVFTATQSVRVKGAGTKPLTKEDVAESIFKSRLSSQVISINRSPSDIQNEVIRFYLCKNRENETNIYVTCNSDYSRCMTHLPENQEEKNVDSEENDLSYNVKADGVY